MAAKVSPMNKTDPKMESQSSMLRKKRRTIIRIDLLENNPDNLSNKYYFVILSLSSSWVMNEI